MSFNGYVKVFILGICGIVFLTCSTPTEALSIPNKECRRDNDCGADFYCDTVIGFCDSCVGACKTPSREKDCLRHCKAFYEANYKTTDTPKEQDTHEGATPNADNSLDADDNKDSLRYVTLVVSVAGAAAVVMLIIVIILLFVKKKKNPDRKPIQDTNGQNVTSSSQRHGSDPPVQIQTDPYNTRADLAPGGAEIDSLLQQ